MLSRVCRCKIPDFALPLEKAWSVSGSNRDNVGNSERHKGEVIIYSAQMYISWSPLGFLSGFVEPQNSLAKA
jgi:hypothetical protein